MSIYLRITLSFIALIVGSLLLMFLISRFEILVPTYLFVIFIYPSLPFILLSTYSFLLGLKGKEHLYWGVGTVSVSFLLSYFFMPSCQISADPKVIHATLKLVCIFAVAFGIGYLWRLGRRDSSALRSVAVAVSLMSLIPFGYIAIAQYDTVFGEDVAEYWNAAGYNEDKTLYYERNIRLSPFPARVLAVRYFNKNGNYVGSSSMEPRNAELADMRLGEIPDGKADILLHKDYEKIALRALSCCKEGYRRDKDGYSVYLYIHEGSLNRMEVFYYPNGILSEIRQFPDQEEGYAKWHGFQVGEFDELGKRIDFNYNELRFFDREFWSITEFHKRDTVPQFNYGYTDVNAPQLDKRIVDLVNNDTEIDDARKQLKERGDDDSGLDAALFLEGFVKDKTVSIWIDADSYFGETEDSDFTMLSSIQQMRSVGSAIAGCKVESARWISRASLNKENNQETCYRVKFMQNNDENTCMILFLFKDYAISSDFRFLFTPDPSDKEAMSSWKKMREIIATDPQAAK